MTIDEIKSLMNEFKRSELTALKIRQGEFELELKKESAVTPFMPPAQNQLAIPAAPPSMFAPPIAEPVQKKSTKYFRSPMVGTFYKALSPDAKPFVSVGDKIEKGTVVCIIEAMKLMNEVEADKEGTIIKILVEDGQMVEFDQPILELS
ncbi:acetyl-CoA carboxylase biotin carboxyl carrier protein [Candidatus Epulonipiscium viviparus]|uniref:acetyl-CoA carboxylase biotin carboxyl carrier protein n=1 Tax=Candidatus Epulonipiscium viviparus TaxID=420336 RepID=UPI00016BFF2D|nr:acetyl-CoA carboxylase biotin carboxyl carrier protein [Candidatus Epulopiscium viviparus]